MATTTLLTNADFELLPDYPGKQELIEGELIELPPAKKPHAGISRNLLLLLCGRVDPDLAYIESGYQLTPNTWLVPDVSVAWPDQPLINDYLQGAPKIAIEIASRGNTAEEIDRKTRLYLAHGAAEVWIIYPRTESMTVYTHDAVQRIVGDFRSPSAGCVVNLPQILGKEKRA